MSSTANGSTNGSPNEPISALVHTGGSPASGIERPPLRGELMPAPGLSVPAGRSKRWSWRALLRYRRMILGIFLLIAGPSVAAIWILMVPQYKAAAEVRISPIRPALVYPGEQGGMVPFYQAYVNTQVSIMRSPTVLQRVLDHPEVQQTAWCGLPPKPLLGGVDPPMDRLRASVDVSPRGNTEIVDVSFKALDGREAALILNVLLDEYVRRTQETSDQDMQKVTDTLAREYDTRSGEIDGREQVVRNLQKELGTGDPGELVAKQRVRVDAIQADLDAKERDAATAAWIQQELEAMLKQAQAASKPASAELANEAKYQGDQEWLRLYLNYRVAQQDRQAVEEKLKPNHPLMPDLIRRERNAEELLQARQDLLDQYWRLQPTTTSAPADDGGLNVSRSLEEVKWRLRRLKYEAELLARDLAAQRAEWLHTFDTAQVLEKEQATIARQREILSAIRAKLDQRAVERNRPAAIEVLTRASTPSHPSGDRRPLLTALALLLGLGLGVGLAFLRIGASQAVHGPEELFEASATPMLGQLPYVPDRKRDHEEQAALSECVRIVRTSLLQALAAQPGSTIMVTSAGPGAGKTTVSVLLARSLARCGKRVLLVDADMRNPSVAKRMGLQPGPGFLATLTSQATDEETIIQVEDEHLNVLPGGKPTEYVDPEIIANGVFAACIARWRAAYDIVLLDCPAVLAVADPKILCQHADSTIFVVREGHCRREHLAEALGQLASMGKPVATVFIGSTYFKSYGSAYYRPYTTS